MVDTAARDGQMSGPTGERVRMAMVLFVTGGFVMASAACGGSGPNVRYQRDNLSEERYAADGSKYEILGVVPFDTEEYDPQIAGRVKRKLRSRGYTAEMYMVQAGGNPSPEMVMSTVCPKAAEADSADSTEAPPERSEKVLPGIDGVVFVTWNRLVLRDCETHGVAYEVQGGYAGVNKMLDWMERYFEGEPSPGD